LKKSSVNHGLFLLLVTIVLAGMPVFAQDGFGFGDESDGAVDSPAGGRLITGAAISGKVSAEMQFFFDDMGDMDKFKAAQILDIFSGNLNFKASGSNAEGVINLDLSPNFTDPAKILSFNEAYVRGFFGNFNITGGLRKLTWGKADTLGPLDVINSFDYTDLSNMADIPSIKIARPLIHASYGIGQFSKIEGVFLPWFEGARFSSDGRWAPLQVTALAGKIERKLMSDITALMGTIPPALAPLIATIPSPISTDGIPVIDQGEILPKTLGLEYAQGGLRFTTTFGPADLGVQYYSGFLPRPALRLNQAGYAALLAAIQAYITGATPDLPVLNPAKLLDTAYNRYHQIGLDYAQVLFGFNLRAELAANITSDLAGDDGLIYNPSIAWSLGFDRDLPVVGINVNLQVNESIRLLDDKVGSDSLFDIEAGTKPTSTRLTASLSRTFLRDALELRATAIWGIEDKDCYIIPAVTWTKGDVAVEVSAGIFAGNKEGELGQYRDNNFITAALSYSF
jgi:hypothetical protein